MSPRDRIAGARLYLVCDARPREFLAAAGADAIVGRSTHEPAQAAGADADADVDYLAVGPVHATPTKPGRPAAGLEYVEWAAANVSKPWFAIGARAARRPGGARWGSAAVSGARGARPAGSRWRPSAARRRPTNGQRSWRPS